MNRTRHDESRDRFAERREAAYWDAMRGEPLRPVHRKPRLFTFRRVVMIIFAAGIAAQFWTMRHEFTRGNPFDAIASDAWKRTVIRGGGDVIRSDQR